MEMIGLRKEILKIVDNDYWNDLHKEYLGVNAFEIVRDGLLGSNIKEESLSVICDTFREKIEEILND